MDIKLVVLDGERIERIGRILLMLIAKHRRTRRALDAAVNERGAERSPPADSAIEAEEGSATRFAGFQSFDNGRCCRQGGLCADAARRRSSGMDEKDWETPLQSFSDRDGY